MQKYIIRQKYPKRFNERQESFSKKVGKRNNNRFPTYSSLQFLRCLLHLLNDGLESLGVVHGEVGKHLAVDLNTSLAEGTHQLRIAQAV